MSETPVLFLIFNRPSTTAEVFEAIRLARPAKLYIAADGPRPDRPGEAEICARVRTIATDVTWPCTVTTLFRDENLGCKRAVSGAIDWFFEQEEAGIILEDDCLPSQDFFPYAADLLNRYAADKRIMAVCGSSYDDKDHPKASYGFGAYADVWGWATWRRAWRLYDGNLDRWPAFDAAGGLGWATRGQTWKQDFWRTWLNATRAGAINTWDYQWMFTVFEQKGLACYPARNLVSNLGFGADATHTRQDAGNPLANRATQSLAFPLVHPTEIVRATDMEDRIDMIRLEMRPPQPQIVRFAQRAIKRVRGLLGAR